MTAVVLSNFQLEQYLRDNEKDKHHQITSKNLLTKD